MRRDLPRLNSTVIEAYAAEPSRATLKAVRDVTKAHGAPFELRVMAAHGGTDLDRGQRAWTNAGLRARRRRRRRTGAGRSGWGCGTCCAPTSAVPRSTSR